jgi:hypothetical protein
VLKELQIEVSELIALLIDNKSDVDLAKNPMLFGRSKHIIGKQDKMNNSELLLMIE